MVAGSSPSSPTTQSCTNRHFCALDAEPQFRGAFAGELTETWSLLGVRDGSRAISVRQSLASANRFPAAYDPFRRRLGLTREVREARAYVVATARPGVTMSRLSPGFDFAAGEPVFDLGVLGAEQ